ncbi:5'/3'-nucleotidase SurE [Ilumatobacter fluminis]|uniref:5'/3'-nucleotidase SurE n=1 Tax=Ilumatobacter fluminis TaxID=467091 RepID=UPI00105BA027|nr:5'/3'-nucleotidase SurE [Ilumatobacter fluminis]
MRILVTNDDGIDAPGIMHLAEAVAPLGEVTVIAPASEYSGAGAAIGAIWESHPTVTRRPDFPVGGIVEAWAIDGPPALCTFYARLGAFGAPFDLVVSGINPGANVGRSVYHSGTVGACLTGRNGGWSGVAISQQSTWATEGQAYQDAISQQKWPTAAAVAAHFVEGMLTDLPSEPVVANVNVPNVELDELQGWSITEVGHQPPRSMTKAQLVERDGEPGVFDFDIRSGDLVDLPVDTDGGAVEAGIVSVSYLSRFVHEPRTDMGSAEASLASMFT